MSEDESLYGLLKRALDGENPSEQASYASHQKHLTIASLEKEIVERDNRIADLKNLVSVLCAAIFGLTLITIWACLVR